MPASYCYLQWDELLLSLPHMDPHSQAFARVEAGMQALKKSGPWRK